MSSSFRTLHLRAGLGYHAHHVVVCGDDGFAHRAAQGLDAVCGETITVVLPSQRESLRALPAIDLT